MAGQLDLGGGLDRLIIPAGDLVLGGLGRELLRALRDTSCGYRSICATHVNDSHRLWKLSAAHLEKLVTRPQMLGSCAPAS